MKNGSNINVINSQKKGHHCDNQNNQDYNLEETDNKTNISGVQTQDSITKQEVIQTISNNTLCHTLSAAEFLALRICNENRKKNAIFDGYKKILKNIPLNKPIFGRYDSYDGGKKKPIIDLIIQFIFLVENFKGDFHNYVNKNGKYDFPNNFTKEQIINIILLWTMELKNIESINGEFSKYDCSKYYLNFLNLITGKPTIDYTMDIYNLESNNPLRGKVNINILPQEYMKAINHLENVDLKNPKSKNIELFGENELKMDEAKENINCPTSFC